MTGAGAGFGAERAAHAMTDAFVILGLLALAAGLAMVLLQRRSPSQ
jgi:hypothetical protein